MSDAFTLRAQAVIDGNEPHEGAAIARWLEDEIERRGNEYPYERALIAIVYGRAVPEHEMGDINLFPLIRATPEQRAWAFLATIHRYD